MDYDFPVTRLRTILPDMLKGNKNWDGRVWNIQVTNTNEKFKELRILVSSSNSSKNWDLRTELREKLIDFLNEFHPGSFSKLRFMQDKHHPDSSKDK